MYSSLRSAAESGWDFSSRWCRDRYCPPDLTNINTINVIPVELNAYLYAVEMILSKLFVIIGNDSDSNLFRIAADKRLQAIYDVLWDENAAKWRDYDITKNRQIFGSEAVSSYIPLWLLPYNESTGQRVLHSLNESGLRFVGGISTSNVNDSQQWDYPNAWPPMQWIMAKAADKYKNSSIGAYLLRNITQTFISTTYIGFNRTGFINEKYNVHNLGESGHGGEYQPQTGFGWTNGVALSFLWDYGDTLVAPTII